MSVVASMSRSLSARVVRSVGTFNHTTRLFSLLKSFFMYIIIDVLGRAWSEVRTVHLHSSLNLIPTVGKEIVRRVEDTQLQRDFIYHIEYKWLVKQLLIDICLAIVVVLPSRVFKLTYIGGGLEVDKYIGCDDVRLTLPLQPHNLRDRRDLKLIPLLVYSLVEI